MAVKRFVVPFATSGDKTTTPDPTDPAGAISYSQGWPVAYQLANTDPAYRPVGRQELNGVLFDVTGAIAELQILGYPEWVAVAGLVVPYRINAYVRHNDIVWRSTIANNSDEPGVGAGTTSWINIAAVQAGLLLRRSIYRNNAGTLQVSINGAAFVNATATFAALTLTARVKATLQGGGGAGGACLATGAGQVSAGSGGSGGGWCEKTLTSGFNGLSIAVGLGGDGPTGTSGGTTSFGGALSAPGGGVGGLGTAVSPSNNFFGGLAGGLGVGGDINGRGGPGTGSFLGSAVVSGYGGYSIFGAGAYIVSGAASTGTTGVNAESYGTGGSGAANGNLVGVTRFGGNGMGGLLILEEYT